MIRLTLSPGLADALQRRSRALCHEIDQGLADRLARSDDPARMDLPEERALYEQVLTMVLVEVLINLTMGLRESQGAHADDHFEPMVAEAVRRTIAARTEMDGKRKAGGS